MVLKTEFLKKAWPSKKDVKTGKTTGIGFAAKP
jgi:hypothetical protein